jgi:nitrogen-specific signal transduction histidine kinase
VPPEIKNRIFEPFFTTKGVGEGTGLGLDISFRIVVNKHHGELSLESEPGDTRFRVWLPLTPQEDGAALAADGMDAVTAAARAAGPGVNASAENKENS